MSTRATYHFEDKDNWGPSVTIYIHYDGYPEGAASYFYRLLVCPNQRGCMATRMIRAVASAELTASHAAHGDTEFQYDVTGSGPGAKLVACERKHGFREGVTERWSPFYTGTLTAFIDKYVKAGWLDDVGGYHPFKQVEGHGFQLWQNKTTALARIHDERNSALPCLQQWAAKGTMTARDATWRSVADTVRRLAEAFELVDVVAEVDALTASLAKPADSAVPA